jgi:bifunctional non-homologous end joining protein LigD
VSLQEYQSKRRFSETPEPQGAAHKAAGPLHFVVQKHHATRLHYDFRLELGGTLKSWAVPKGPSLNPLDKRLAIMVEDHPLDYANFEGIIPKGNYGAGTVMVWDQGTYHAPGVIGREQNELVLAEALAKGDLKIVLHGKKLHGAYVLFRLKGDEENHWMLVKKQDTHATDKPVLEADRSVLSQRNMEEIAQSKAPPRLETEGELWNDAPRAPMPRNIKPMLASSAEEPFDDPDWLFEIKWDGFRAIAEVEPDRVRLYSRNNLSLQTRFPLIVDALGHLAHQAILDGEIVVLDESGRSKIQLLQDYQRSRGTLVYYVFDLLYLDGHDLRNLPLVRRKEILAGVLTDLPGVRLSEHISEHGRAFFEAVASRQLEGIVAKLATSRYQAGRRSKTWLKIKTDMRQLAVIGGFTEERANRRSLGALVLGVFEGNDLIYIGHVGTGFTRRTLEELRGKLEPLVQKSSPFKERPTTNAPTHWVRPELVCEVSFSEWTKAGALWHPVFLGLRDVPATAVRRDSSEPQPSKPRPPEGGWPGLESSEAPVRQTRSAASAGASEDSSPGHPPSEIARPTNVRPPTGGLVIDGHVVKVTNLEKLYWPDEGFTKGNLIDYYREVASFILPYLKDRPESLRRQPGGMLDRGFFHKNISTQPPPDWVQTVMIRSDSREKTARTILCQDEATLVYVANLGCIELNPWHARVGTLDQADYLVLDLDPEDISFQHVTEVAQAIRKLLDQIEVPSCCKTSGKRGLHIYVPFGARYTHDQAKQFGNLVAQVVHRRLPGVTSILRDPVLRQQRVYLDYLQNGKGKTLAAPYSVRPYPNATVSTPLKWAEVNKRLDPSKFTMRTLPKRLEKVGDLWQPVLGPGIDLQGCLERLASLYRRG